MLLKFLEFKIYQQMHSIKAFMQLLLAALLQLKVYRSRDIRPPIYNV